MIKDKFFQLVYPLSITTLAYFLNFYIHTILKFYTHTKVTQDILKLLKSMG